MPIIQAAPFFQPEATREDTERGNQVNCVFCSRTEVQIGLSHVLQWVAAHQWCGSTPPPHPIASSLTAACRRTPPAQFRPGESTRTNRRDHRIAQEEGGAACMLNSAILGAITTRSHCRSGCSRCRVSRRREEEEGVGRTSQNTRSHPRSGRFQGHDTRATQQWLVSTVPSSTGRQQPQPASGHILRGEHALRVVMGVTTRLSRNPRVPNRILRTHRPSTAHEPSWRCRTPDQKTLRVVCVYSVQEGPRATLAGHAAPSSPIWASLKTPSLNTAVVETGFRVFGCGFSSEHRPSRLG